MPGPVIDTVRILEIGNTGQFKQAFPDQTRFFNSGKLFSRTGDPRPRDLTSLWALIRELRKGDYDLIICMPEERSPWRLQSIARFLLTRQIWSNLRRPLRLWAPQLLRLFRKVPVVVLDSGDPSYINRDNFFLMDRAELFFKRELPPDEWRVLTKTASSTQPSFRLRNMPRFRRRIAKLRPLPLGLMSGSERDLPLEAPEKTADVFFAGTWKGFTVREKALAEIEALRAEGYVIDIAREPMPRRDFYRRCAGAWLTLSPEGHGWDCFRHYEAAACWSVPLINQPWIQRHQPLIEGEHAIYYDVEPGLLAARAREALADKRKLAAMAQAGHDHVLANHTKARIARYVLETSLAAIYPRQD